MKKCLLSVVVLLLISAEAFPQKYITLNVESFEPSGQAIYIQEVIDKRSQQTLGRVKDEEGGRVEIKLKGGAPAAVQGFMDASFPQKEGSSPVVIHVEALEIQESKTNIIDRIIRVHTTLAFLAPQPSGELKEVYRIQHNEDDVYALPNKKEVFSEHEKRVRAALEYCMHSFLANYEPAPTDASVQHFAEDPEATTEFNKDLGNWYHMATFKHIMQSDIHEGWAISYTGFLDKDKGFIMPYEISFSQLEVISEEASERGYNFVGLDVIGLGLYRYIKVIPGVYGALGVNVPLGLESLRDIDGDGRSTRFVIGIAAVQGIRIIPWKNFGLVLGADVFQQVQTSEIFRRDIGFELVFGFNF